MVIVAKGSTPSLRVINFCLDLPERMQYAVAPVWRRNHKIIFYNLVLSYLFLRNPHPQLILSLMQRPITTHYLEEILFCVHTYKSSFVYIYLMEYRPACFPRPTAAWFHPSYSSTAPTAVISDHWLGNLGRAELMHVMPCYT